MPKTSKRGISHLIDQVNAEVAALTAASPDAATIAAWRVAEKDPDLSRIVAAAYHAGRIKGATDLATVVYDRIEEIVRRTTPSEEEAP